MGKVSIITPDQQFVLDQIKKSKFISETFYFTGGTALAEHYLQHRYSDDIDLFSFEKVENQIIFSFMTEISKDKYSIESRLNEVVYSFFLKPSQGDVLKVDFGNYPYRCVEKPKIIEGIQIDSLLDIAVNKLMTVSQRTSVKDFVDLYFLLQSHSLYDLMEGVKVKFGVKIEPFLLSSDFLKVDDFTFLPRMIKPLKLSDLVSFFRDKATRLSKESVE